MLHSLACSNVNRMCLFLGQDAERSEREAEDLGKLKEELRESQQLQGLAERRLREAKSERDHLLAELEDQDDQVRRGS